MAIDGHLCICALICLVNVFKNFSTYRHVNQGFLTFLPEEFLGFFSSLPKSTFIACCQKLPEHSELLLSLICRQLHLCGVHCEPKKVNTEKQNETHFKRRLNIIGQICFCTCCAKPPPPRENEPQAEGSSHLPRMKQGDGSLIKGER